SASSMSSALLIAPPPSARMARVPGSSSRARVSGSSSWARARLCRSQSRGRCAGQKKRSPLLKSMTPSAPSLASGVALQTWHWNRLVIGLLLFHEAGDADQAGLGSPVRFLQREQPRVGRPSADRLGPGGVFCAFLEGPDADGALPAGRGQEAHRKAKGGADPFD